MDEKKIGKVMQHDFSKGTDAFRESLLQRALRELADNDVVALEDDELEFLAAAGRPHSVDDDGFTFPF